MRKDYAGSPKAVCARKRGPRKDISKDRDWATSAELLMGRACADAKPTLLNNEDERLACQVTTLVDEFLAVPDRVQPSRESRFTADIWRKTVHPIRHAMRGVHQPSEQRAALARDRIVTSFVAH